MGMIMASERSASLQCGEGERVEKEGAVSIVVGQGEASEKSILFIFIQKGPKIKNLNDSLMVLCN